jgi:Fe-S cluster biogenesis protein NfuA
VSLELELRVRQIDSLLHAHAGGLELQDGGDGERVRVRYTGMCTGCPYRALTTEATVRPLLMELSDVQEVEVAGGRISEEALARVRAAFGVGVCPAVVTQ